jgi:hypothetical protein
MPALKPFTPDHDISLSNLPFHVHNILSYLTLTSIVLFSHLLVLAMTMRLRSLEVFRHRRLSSLRSIRLLTLFPSQDFSSRLEGTLTEVGLDSISRNSNTYEALSYVWGVSRGTEQICCDGQQLLVTPNCDSALRHLRLPDTFRSLWVDAICIDQGKDPASVTERSAQVALMGEIYQKAARTLCWFGKGTNYTDELIEYLGLIGSRPSKRGLSNFLKFDGKYQFWNPSFD